MSFNYGAYSGLWNCFYISYKIESDITLHFQFRVYTVAIPKFLNIQRGHCVTFISLSITSGHSGQRS